MRALLRFILILFFITIALIIVSLLLSYRAEGVKYMELTAGAAIGIGAAITALSQGANQFIQSGRNRKQRKWQEDENVRAFEKNLTMWNLQNAYNSPSAQMARLEKAGLNPHLIYGKGTVGNATSMPNYQPAKGQFEHSQFNIPIGGMIGDYISLKKMPQELANLKAVEDQTRSQTEFIKTQDRINLLKEAFIPEQQAYDREAFKKQLEKYTKEIDKLAEEKRLAQFKADWQEITNTSWLDDQVNPNTSNVYERLGLRLLRLYEKAFGETKTDGRPGKVKFLEPGEKYFPELKP